MVNILRGLKRLIWLIKENYIVKPSYRLKPHLVLRTKTTKNYFRVSQRQISLIVIHATGSSSLNSTVAWFKDPKSSVSAHFVIDKDGIVVCMVPIEWIAWHAGVSEWKGQTNVNRFSVGIELVNKDDGLDPYPKEQMEVLLTLVYALGISYNLTTDDVVYHKDISPGRKSDPKYIDDKGFKESLSFYQEKEKALRQHVQTI